MNDRGKRLTNEPLSARRMALQDFAENFRGNDHVYLSPATSDHSTAQRWMRQGAASGLDGVVAKRLNCEYTSGDRTGMVKVKRIRTADCVVGGFRLTQKGGEVGSLLLGLYNHAGKLDHVGFSSSFNREDRKKLKAIVLPLIAEGDESNSSDAGFSGKAPGGPSRWTTPDRNTEWFQLKHKLVGGFSILIISPVGALLQAPGFCAGVRRKSRSNAELIKLQTNGCKGKRSSCRSTFPRYQGTNLVG